MSPVATVVSDRNIPGLGIALDRSALCDLLTTILPECRQGVRIQDGRIGDVQYTPGAGAHVLWKLAIWDSETNRRCRQLVAVKLLRRDEPAPREPIALVRRYAELRSRKRMALELPLRTPWVFVPGAHLVVCAFPLDEALPTLLDAVDPQAMRVALHQAWQPRRSRVRRVRVATLSYTPEARVALRYEVHADNKDTGLPEIRRLVGKLHVRRSPARLFAGHWAVWRKSLGRVSIAPPAGYLATTRVSLQEFLSGGRLSDLAERGRFVTRVRETARAIACVHSLTLPLLAHRGAEKEISSIDRWVRILTSLCPDQARRLERLRDRLQREVADRIQVKGTVHADFHLANVLADADGVTLIDWDQVAHGDPMVDVGRVLASLRVSSLRVHGTIQGFAGIQEAFLQAYLDRTHDDERRARLFEAVSLLIAAAGPFRLQREGWAQGAEMMLDEVERALERSLTGARVAGTPPGLRRDLPFEERLEWALDPQFAQALLVPLVQERHGADIEVTECLPAVLERGRNRLYVRWTVKGYRGKDRWRSSVQGIGFREHSGRGLWQRMQAATNALHDVRDALQLPDVLGHLGPLSMLVFVPPAGDSLAEVLGSEAEFKAVERMAAALARFHALRFDPGKERETIRDLNAVRRRIERLEQQRHGAAPAARALFDELTPVVSALGERRAPTVRGLQRRHVWIDGSDVRASVFDDVIASDPIASVGDLLSQMDVHALSRGVSTSASKHLRFTYGRLSGASDHELAAFEALALLTRACRRATSHPQESLTATLVAHATGLL